MKVDRQEEQWIEGVRRGDLEAFEQIYRIYYRRVYGFLYRLCWDTQRAEDLLQEAFLKLWRKAATILPGKPLSPWLYRVARNAFIDSERRLRAAGTGQAEILDARDSNLDLPRPKQPSFAAVQADERARESQQGLKRKAEHAGGSLAATAVAPARDDPAAGLQRKEREQAVREALLTLDEDKRVVIVLSFYQGLRMREIAEILEVPEGTVKSRAYYGERQLRAALLDRIEG